MAFDGLVIKGIIEELNKNIINSRVEKIYQQMCIRDRNMKYLKNMK